MLSEYLVSSSHCDTWRKNINTVIKVPFNIVSDLALPTIPIALNASYITEQFQHMDTICQPHESFYLKSIEVIRYKAGKRCLIEYICELRGKNTFRTVGVIGKIRTKRSGKKDYRLQSELWTHGFSRESSDGVSIAFPLGRLKKANMWLQEKLMGRNLNDVLLNPDSINIMPDVARAAHKIHISKMSSQRKHTLLDEMNILRDRFQVICREYPLLEKKLHYLLKKAQSISCGLINRKLRPVHRDFYPEQIIVGPTPGEVYIVDFDLFCMGDPAIDIGNFIGHLTEYSLREYGDGLALKHYEETVLESFVALAGSEERSPVKVYALLTLMRHIYICTLFPQRQPFMLEIIDLCEQKMVQGYCQ